MNLDLSALLTAFAGCGVEGVEALTIVLAVGLTRSWRDALGGAIAAVAVLVVPVIAFGAWITANVPERDIKLIVGTLILLFGIRWLRKAILRSGGALSLHDEAAEYTATVAELNSDRRDWAAFVVAFKAVLLEGLEGAFIVFAVGSSSHHLGSAALGGLLAVIAVIALGVVVRRPLARVPENTVKLCVGLALATLGTFWTAEGAGVAWPGDVVSIAGVVAIYAAATVCGVRLVRRRVGSPMRDAA